MRKKIIGILGTAAIACAITGTIAKPAEAVGTVPPEVAAGIDTAMATIDALNPVAQKALSVALLPLGAFLTLAFVSKVMARV